MSAAFLISPANILTRSRDLFIYGTVKQNLNADGREEAPHSKRSLNFFPSRSDERWLPD